MLDFFTTNWFWILFLGGMLLMHLGHRGHGGHGGAGTRARTPAISLSKSPNASTPRAATSSSPHQHTPPAASRVPERTATGTPLQAPRPARMLIVTHSEGPR